MPKWALTMRLLGLGWYVAICVVLGVVGGLWLDKRFHTLPVFTLVGTVLGTVVAFYGVYKMVLPLVQDEGKGKK